MSKKGRRESRDWDFQFELHNKSFEHIYKTQQSKNNFDSISPNHTDPRYWSNLDNPRT